MSRQSNLVGNEFLIQFITEDCCFKSNNFVVLDLSHKLNRSSNDEIRTHRVWEGRQMTKTVFVFIKQWNDKNSQVFEQKKGDKPKGIKAIWKKKQPTTTRKYTHSKNAAPLTTTIGNCGRYLKQSMLHELLLLYFCISFLLLCAFVLRFMIILVFQFIGWLSFFFFVFCFFHLCQLVWSWVI